MSKLAYTCIEQLDLAAKQLKYRNASYARFALILIDNVVELVIHSACAHQLAKDELWIKLSKPKISADERLDASSQQLDRKLKFCKSKKIITDHQFDGVLIYHKYRNELYHAGLRHDEIIWDIAWQYYDVAVEIFEKSFPYHMWGSNYKVSAAVKKHAGPEGKKVLDKINEIAMSLMAVKPENDRSLAQALSHSATNRVNEVIGALEFLVTDDPNGRSESTTIHEIQFYEYISSDDNFAKTVFGSVKTPAQYSKAIAFVSELWKPKYTSNPLNGFLTRASKIENSQSPLNAIKLFENFKRDFEYISILILRAAAALDEYIQHQIDVARGK